MLVSFMFLAAAGLTPAAAPSGNAISEDQEIVCRSERTVGSNMSQRICKTKEKWAEERQRSRDGVRDAQSRDSMLRPEGWYANKRPGSGN